MYVCGSFCAVGASYLVFVLEFIAVVVSCAEWAFCLVLAEPRGVPETLAFVASGYGYEGHHLAHAPLEFEFVNGK